MPGFSLLQASCALGRSPSRGARVVKLVTPRQAFQSLHEKATALSGAIAEGSAVQTSANVADTD